MPLETNTELPKDLKLTKEFIEGYINYKMDNEVTPWRTRPNPMEFVMYYSV